MGVFEQFPYTNFHELNLDWIIAELKKLDKKVNEDLQEIIQASADAYISNLVLNALYDPDNERITIEVQEG